MACKLAVNWKVMHLTAKSKSISRPTPGICCREVIMSSRVANCMDLGTENQPRALFWSADGKAQLERITNWRNGVACQHARSATAVTQAALLRVERQNDFRPRL